MRFQWQRIDANDFLAVFSVTVNTKGILTMPWPCRLHRWQMVMEGVAAGAAGAGVVHLAEVASFGVGVVGASNSNIVSVPIAIGTAAAPASNHVDVDWGDEGFPLPKPKIPQFATPYYCLSPCVNAALVGGFFTSIVDYSFDYPYETAKPAFVG